MSGKTVREGKMCELRRNTTILEQCNSYSSCASEEVFNVFINFFIAGNPDYVTYIYINVV